MSLLDDDNAGLIFTDTDSLNFNSSDSDDLYGLMDGDSEDDEMPEAEHVPDYATCDAESSTDTACSDTPELYQSIVQFPLPHVMDFKSFTEVAIPYCMAFIQLDYERERSLGLDCSWESYIEMRKASLGTFWTDQYQKYLNYFGISVHAKKNTCPKGMGPQGRLYNPNEHDNYDLTTSTTFQLFGWMKQKDRDRKLRRLFNLCKKIASQGANEPLNEPVPQVRETYARRKGPFYWWLDANWGIEWFRLLALDVFRPE